MSQMPSHNIWNAAFGEPPRKSGLVGPMLVGALIFAVGCGSGLAVGWFAGITTSFLESPEGLGTAAPADTVVNYTLPDSVTVGEPFVVRVTLTEVSGEVRSLQSIDLYNDGALLLAFESSSPPQASIDDDYDYLQVNYALTLQPNESRSFDLTLTCDTPGPQTVYLDVYFAETGSTSDSFELTVRPPPGGFDPEF